jgi:ubiquinone/menaquinone biosynthesis C-methylase UbiE
MPRTLWILGISLLMMSSGCGGHEHRGHDAHDATVHHSFDEAAKWAKRFDAPERDAWQRPDAVIEALGIRPGQTVADIGAGTGYFSIRMSPVVGPEGRVFAVDLEPAMVEYIRERAGQAGLENVEPVLALADGPGIGPASADLVFICDTWHHISNRLEYLDELRAVLRPGGRVAIVDFKQGDLPVGPPEGLKLSREAVIAEFSEAGWKLREDHDVLPYQYVLVFEP